MKYSNKDISWLEEYNEKLRSYASNNSNIYLFCFEKLFDINEVKKLFDFLGEELDENKYNFVINNNL